MVRDVALPVETVVPNGEGVDHASAISLLEPDAVDPDARLLVVYASPAANRRPWPDTVFADRVRIARLDADLDPVALDDPGSVEPVELAALDPAAAPGLADSETPDPDPDPVDVETGDEETGDDEPPPGRADEPGRQPRVDHPPAVVLFPDRGRTFGT